MRAIQEQAARNREEGATNDRLVLAVLAAAGDAGVVPGRELAERAGLPQRTASEVVTRLVARGLARRDGRRRVWSTEAGRTEVGADAPGLALAPALDVAVACFPAEALRANVRLQLSALVARWHLAGEHDTGWGAFISLGPTGTGKTSLASFVCRVTGLDELRAIRSAFRETPGSLVGRRERDTSSKTGWRVQRSPTLELPYVCIDEWDKASKEVQAAAGGLLLGHTVDELEGERFELRPTVHITLNTGPEGLRVLHSAIVRRSVVLDTTPLRALLSDLDRDMHRLLASGEVPIPRLDLDQLRPVLALPRGLRELLRSELRAGLTDDGREHSDVESLSRIALGRAAITGGELEQAVIATVYDYLTCAATLGHARDGYSAQLGHRLGAGALLPDPDAAEQQRLEVVARRRTRELEGARERDALVEARARLEQQLKGVIKRLDERGLTDCSLAQHVDAHGIAALLRSIRADVTSARSREALQAAEDRARDPVLRAGRLLQHIDGTRDKRCQIAARVEPALRSRSIEGAPARTAAALFKAMLPGAHGPELDALDQQAQQLEQAPPISEAEQRRRIKAFQDEQIRIARLVNPHG